MPFGSQFSLSLELTKLLPLRKVVEVGGRQLLALARELQKSGSDIVVEDDLVEVFARNQMEPRFESTFRTAVQETRVQSLSDYLEIVLESGAGPTVRRSLREPQYFPMVVQLSLLASTHDPGSLASALSHALRQRLEGAPSAEQNYPGYDGLLGTLQACRDQTSAFNWNQLFIEVEHTLGAVLSPQSRALPFPVLQAFLDVLCAVQRFPEERYIHIVCSQGEATVVVWAHHILGLNVTVQREESVTRFGEGTVHIAMDLTSRKSRTSVCLLQPAAEEGAEIFRIDQDVSRDVPLGADIRSLAYGYGRICLETHIGDYHHLILRVAHQVAAYSCALIQQASKHPCWSPKPTWTKTDRSEAFLSTSRRMFDVACFLFGGLALDVSTFDELSEGPILGSWARPESSDFYLLSNDCWTASPDNVLSDMKQWCIAQDTAEPDIGPERVAQENTHRLMVLLVCISCSLTYTLDLDSCRDLPLIRYSNYGAITNDLFASALNFRNLGPFRTLAALLVGEAGKSSANFEQAALVSSHGWSIYLPSIAMKDPGSIQPYVFAVAPGVPMRYSERKLWILDSSNLLQPVPDPLLHHDPHKKRTFISGPGVNDIKVYVGIRGNAFEASVRVGFGGGHYSIGFRQLQHMRCDFRLIQGCDHPCGTSDQRHSLARLNQRLALSLRQSQQGSMFIGSSHHGVYARWMMMSVLWTWPKLHCPRDLDLYRFLKGQDCCSECALEKTHDPDGIACVVL